MGRIAASTALPSATRAAIFRAWVDRLPETSLLRQLTGFAGAEPDAVARLVAARPLGACCDGVESAPDVSPAS